MAKESENNYLELLQSEKDPSKAFAINLSGLLQGFIHGFRNGDIPGNFKSAALIIQACSSLYGKKVEHLHSMATTLYSILIKNETERAEIEKANNAIRKEKASKKEKLFDPFSTEIIRGKNLSCLSRENAAKRPNASKKAPKKAPFKVHSFVPVHLLPFEGEDKGDIFYDTKGEPVGYKNDFALNTMKVTASGWMHLATLSPDLIGIVYDDPKDDIAKGGDCNERDSSDEGDNSDEGFPPSSGCPSSAPTAPNSQVPLSQESDEGMGTLQSDDPASVGIEVMSAEIENISMDDFPAVENSDARAVRKSMKQLDPKEETLKKKTKPGDVYVAVKAPIEKKNTVSLPLKLSDENHEIPSLDPASIFCGRTFFDSDKAPKLDHFSLITPAFFKNSKLLAIAIKCQEIVNDCNSKMKDSRDKDEEDENVEADEIEEEDCDKLKEANKDGKPKNLEIVNSPTDDRTDGEDENPNNDQVPVGDVSSTEPVVDLDTQFRLIAEKQSLEFRDNVFQNFEQAKVNEKVRIWQKGLVPFLNEIKDRDKFDINVYGSSILSAFRDSNRRQTMTFREICQGKEKWEIHRMFMALLPLANMGNVELANGSSEDGEEDEIMVTLLSRKMHHLELEEFGHTSGEH